MLIIHLLIKNFVKEKEPIGPLKTVQIFLSFVFENVIMY